MRIAVVSFTLKGALLAGTLSQSLAMRGHFCTAYAMPRHAGETGLVPLVTPLSEWTASVFGALDALVFISACGVAVRAIAPLLKSKVSDPAVVVLDDNARFSISLLSGHIGGANALAEEIAHVTGAQAVVSTATDGAGVFSVDSWANRSGCALWELPAAKAISAALLDGTSVGFASGFPVEGDLPEGVELKPGGPLGFAVTVREVETPFDLTLHLVPRAVVLGIGCKRSTSAGAIAERVCAALAEHGISERAVCAVASIDLKADEPGLVAFCKGLGLALATFSAQELSAVAGEFTPSEFVRGVTGTDNVCERAAVLGAGPGGVLLMKKQAENGVTVAAALRDWRVRF